MLRDYTQIHRFHTHTLVRGVSRLSAFADRDTSTSQASLLMTASPWHPSDHCGATTAPSYTSTSLSSTHRHTHLHTAPLQTFRNITTLHPCDIKVGHSYINGRITSYWGTVNSLLLIKRLYFISLCSEGSVKWCIKLIILSVII